MPLAFNQRAAIAASVQELTEDLDIPVYVEGDVWNGQGAEDMDPGEAARIVVDVVLDHPYVKASISEAEEYWETLKWIIRTSTPDLGALEHPSLPPYILRTVIAATNAVAADYVADGHILDDPLE